MIPYELEGLVVERLKAFVKDDWLVLRSSSFKKASKQQNNVIYVAPNDLNVMEQRRGQVALSESVLVIVGIRHAGSQVVGDYTRDDAGPVLATVIQSLLGWVPEASCDPMKMESAPTPEFEAGFGFYPLIFKTSYVFSGQTTL